MSTVSTEKMMAQIACKAIDDKKGQDIKIIDIHNVSVIADYFVIASGTNSNQVQAIVDNVRSSLDALALRRSRLRETAIPAGFSWLRRCDRACV